MKAKRWTALQKARIALYKAALDYPECKPGARDALEAAAMRYAEERLEP